MVARCIAVWAAASLLCLGNASTTTTSASKLTVLKPKGVFENDAISHSSSLFGDSNFGPGNGVTATVKVVKREPNSNHCPADMSALDSGVVLLLSGFDSCTFVNMAIHAQGVGAVGLIVVQDKCLKTNYETKGDEFKKYCDSLNGGTVDALSYMGGVSNAVHIPAMIISRYDALKIQECNETPEKKITGVTCDSSVLLMMRWNIPQETKVDWELWSSALLNADIFTKRYWWETIIPEIDAVTTFTPRFFVWDGKKLGCSEKKDHCQDACHNKNRYCHYDPDGLGKGRISGQSISQENMRQSCAYQQVAEGSTVSWWKYVACVADKCTEKNKEKQADFYSEACSKECHGQADLDFSKTMECVKVNGGYGEDSGVNTLWEAELEARKGTKIERLPTLVVNGKMVDFGTSLKNVLGALCSAFKDPPSFCPCVQGNDVNLAQDSSLLDTCMKNIKQPDTGIGYFTLFLILSLVVGSLVAGFLFIRRKERRQMRSEFHEDMRNIMGEYMRMDGDGNIAGDVDGSFLNGGEGTNGQYQHVVELK
uniref:Vacuolar sorting receptor thioredoxin-like domain-containing protein n=1 Tax=Mucochytrium quahogii TaxID=96639 RepID=A0A7S2WCT3_9STRA|mmetsp:Transcript_402/g.722  ORF Transcript_402/g.722 Transcript_402/m.722 type:complete len:538 (+) Transcript_402:244-1857(+)